MIRPSIVWDTSKKFRTKTLRAEGHSIVFGAYNDFMIVVLQTEAYTGISIKY